jgi:hypothetical protein
MHDDAPNFACQCGRQVYGSWLDPVEVLAGLFEQGRLPLADCRRLIGFYRPSSAMVFDLERIAEVIAVEGESAAEHVRAHAVDASAVIAGEQDHGLRGGALLGRRMARRLNRGVRLIGGSNRRRAVWIGAL